MEKKPFRGYIRTSKAWYADTVAEEFRDEVSFSLYEERHGDYDTYCELTMFWDEDETVLECPDGSWDMLFYFQDVFVRLAKYNDQCITEDEFCGILDECGFKDITKYKQTGRHVK